MEVKETPKLVIKQEIKTKPQRIVPHISISAAISPKNKDKEELFMPKTLSKEERRKTGSLIDTTKTISMFPKTASSPTSFVHRLPPKTDLKKTSTPTLNVSVKNTLSKEDKALSTFLKRLTLNDENTSHNTSKHIRKPSSTNRSPTSTKFDNIFDKDPMNWMKGMNSMQQNIDDNIKNLKSAIAKKNKVHIKNSDKSMVVVEELLDRTASRVESEERKLSLNVTTIQNPKRLSGHMRTPSEPIGLKKMTNSSIRLNLKREST